MCSRPTALGTATGRAGLATEEMRALSACPASPLCGEFSSVQQTHGEPRDKDDRDDYGAGEELEVHEHDDESSDDWER